MASPLIRAAQSAMKAATAVGATQTATLRRSSEQYDPTTGGHHDTDPITGEFIEEPWTDYTWTGVLESYSELLTRGGETIGGGSNVLSSDRKWTGAAGDIAIDPDPETDKLIVGDTTYTIVNAKPDPAGALWVLQVRR